MSIFYSFHIFFKILFQEQRPQTQLNCGSSGFWTVNKILFLNSNLILLLLLILWYCLRDVLASLVDQMVKILPAVQEIWVQSLGWEDPLEKGMTTPSAILAWRIPWTEEPGRLQSMGSKRAGHNWTTFAFTSCMKVKTEISSLLHKERTDSSRKICIGFLFAIGQI